MGRKAGRPTGDLIALGLLLDPVRRSLYEHVAGSDRPVRRDAAARATGISRELAAFHLEKLVAAGLIEARASPAGRTMKRGRPPKLYRRVRAELEVSVPARRYRLLGRIFADAVATRWHALRRPALASARKLGRELSIGLDLRPARREWAHRLANLTRKLSGLGYEPRVESDRIRLRNCPFGALAEYAPDRVCQLNLALLEGLCQSSGRGVTAVADPARSPGWCCTLLRLSRS